MFKKRLPKSTRKFIRLQKARIRRDILDESQQEKEIKKLYQKLGDTKKTKIKKKISNK